MIYTIYSIKSLIYINSL